MNENTKQTEKRSFWEINVYASKDTSGNDVIRIEKTITSWERPQTYTPKKDERTPHWIRVGKKTESLPFEICTPNARSSDTAHSCVSYCSIKPEQRGNQSVRAENGIIRFDGGYLKVKDLQIEPDYSTPYGYSIHEVDGIKTGSQEKLVVLETWMRNIRSSLDLDVISDRLRKFLESVENFFKDLLSLFENEPYQIVAGENIKLKISFANTSSEVNQVSELFHLEQDENSSVSLTDNIENHENSSSHRLKFEISNQSFETLPFEIQHGDSGNNFDAMLNIRVAQDFDRHWIREKDNKGAYFECFSELVPLIILNAADEVGSHKFTDKHQRMFIGSGPDGRNIFKGTIGRVFFDPNSSCTKC